MSNLKLGIDVGFGATKAVGSNGKQKVFPSQIATFKPVKFISGIENQDYIDSMAIYNKSERYFVGKSAGLQATANATVERKRTVNREGEILLLSAIGNLIDHSPDNIDLVVGLPISNYDLKDSYIQMASGKHDFTLLKPDGAIYKDISVTVDRVKVLPQPFGSLFNAVLDKNGEFIASSIAKGRAGIIDIGYKTTDLLRSENMQYIEKNSTSIDEVGGFKIACTLSDLIYDKHQIRIPIEDMDQYVRGANLTVEGDIISITELRREAFKISAEAILSRVLSLWSDLKLLDLVIISGGTSLLIGDYLKGRLGKMALTVPEPVLSNALGYLKYAYMAWGLK